jgi:SulP family sulfate permease
MINFPANGYRSKSLVADIALGVTDGLDSALWCYAFASVIYTGILSVFLPVGVLSLLLGWAVLSIFIAVTTRASLHMANIDEQAVVIISTIGLLMVADFGQDAASSRGLATLLAIIVISSLAASVSFYLVGHYRLSRLLEMLPYPVVCGFMAGIGWLLLEAGVLVATGVPISTELPSELSENNRIPLLLVTLAFGAGLTFVVNKIEKSWIMPAASAAIAIIFYLSVVIMGTSHSELVAGGWLFEISDSDTGALGAISQLSLADVDFRFMAGVVPQMLTMIFLLLISSSMSLTALKAASKSDLDTAGEFKNVSGANLLCSAVCSPPGYTDVVASTLYEEFGASSRWMPLTSSAVCLLVAVMGGWIIAYVPKVLVGATVFLFAFQTLYEWMYQNVRSFKLTDYAIVCTILGTVIFAGFMQGMAVGIILTVLLFVFRYSMISAIQARHTLRDHRSSVERSASSNRVLNLEGSHVIVYTLRGFLFFGTANTVLDTISDDPRVKSGRFRAILMDMKRVTGIDVSALNTFVQIKKICVPHDVKLVYSGVAPEMIPKIAAVDAVSEMHCQPLIFEETDFAVEFLEELLLKDRRSKSSHRTIGDFLAEIFDDQNKIRILSAALTPIECKKGEVLFEQGALDTNLYIVESGTLSAFLAMPSGASKRIRKFRPGSLIGELSAYLSEKRRTATVIAREDSILYCLTAEKLAQMEHNLELAVCIHELVAKTLAERVTYMNRRLVMEFE